MSEPQSADLDALVRRVDPDRWLSSRFISDPMKRADVIALYAYDYELARAPKASSNALLGEIRLTWWREALDEIYAGRPTRHHPGVQALAAAVRRRDLPREPLEAMNDARYRELDPTAMTEAEAMAWALNTGGHAARLASFILDPGSAPGLAAYAGTLWAMGKRFGDDPPHRVVLGDMASHALAHAPSITAAAFPAAAHGALIIHPARTELGKRLRLVWSVARGRL